MMHVTPESLAILTPAKIKARALEAFEEACRAPDGVDWHGLTILMHAALTAKPKRKSSDDTPDWWHCYDYGKKAVRVSIEVQFSDGRTVRASVNSDPGKAFNIGRGLRVAIAFYRTRIFKAAGAPEIVRLVTYRLGYCEPFEASERSHAGADHVAVPDIASVTRLDTGETFDAAECSRLTTEWRAGTWTLEAGQFRASLVPPPDGPTIYEPEEAARRWTAYQLALDYAWHWLQHAKPIGGWYASMEEARAAKEAPPPCDDVEACEDIGETILAEETAIEPDSAPVAPVQPVPHPSPILRRLSASLAASVHPWPSLPVKPAFPIVRIAA